MQGRVPPLLDLVGVCSILYPDIDIGFKEFLFNLRQVSVIYTQEIKVKLVFSHYNTINSSKWKVREKIFKWKKNLLGSIPESKKEISSGS